MRHSIDMGGLSSKVFPLNYRQPSQSYSATIQNNTTQSLTVTVTNQNILADPVAAYSVPSQGALVIAAGEMKTLSDAYVGALLSLSLAGSAGETIDIVEVG